MGVRFSIALTLALSATTAGSAAAAGAGVLAPLKQGAPVAARFPPAAEKPSLVVRRLAGGKPVRGRLVCTRTRCTLRAKLASGEVYRATAKASGAAPTSWVFRAPGRHLGRPPAA